MPVQKVKFRLATLNAGEAMPRSSRRWRSPLAVVEIWFIKAWRAVISPLYGSVCKYHPSCSAYGLRAVETHGALRGSWLIVRRLARCHPWSLGGVDFVPGTDEAKQWQQHPFVCDDPLHCTDPAHRVSPDQAGVSSTL